MDNTGCFRATLLTAVLLIGACGGGGGGTGSPTGNSNRTTDPTPKNLLELDGFSSCSEYRDYYAEALTQEYLTGFWAGIPCWGCELAVLDSRGAPQATAAGASEDGGFSPTTSNAPPADVSQTNTQEAGVDEADLIEVDPDTGDLYIVARNGRELLVVDAVPAESMRIIARVELPSQAYARGIYLDKTLTHSRIVVVMDAGLYYIAGGDQAFAPQRQSGTELLFYDVSDPASPQLSNRYWTEGYTIDSRRIGSRVHLVTQYSYGIPSALASDDSFSRLVYEDYQRALSNKDEAEQQRLGEEIERRVSAAVAAAELSELLPSQAIGGGEPETLSCGAVQRPELSQRLGMVMITSIDSNGLNPNTTGTINNAWQIYASASNVYLLQTSGGWWFRESQTQQTAIYQFSIGAGQPQPRGAGLVDGWINNSYSLSEHEGSLRVATTEGRFNGSRNQFDQTNHLTVLNANAGLVPQGQVRDFIRDERIFSARFIGDKGYVVTFLQVDPLFAFDLSDPFNPRLAGQVEIPGFSTYIHPLGADHLLTIGRAGGEGGVGVGRSFQLQIFDVSDLGNPTQVTSQEPDLTEDEYAYSLAEYDPHAFTYLDSEGLLSIPVQISSPDAGRSFSGFFTYNIDPSSIAEYARIDHKQEGSGSSGCPPGRTADQPCSSFAPVIYNEPLRTVILREGGIVPGRRIVYTMSSALLKALDAGAVPTPVSQIELDQN